MKTFAFLALFAVSACSSASAPVSSPDYNFRSNTSISQKTSDLLSCRVAAENIVPQKLVVKSDTAHTYCSNYRGNVSCNTYGGDVRSYDANSGLRGDVLDQCLIEKGYQQAAVPVCPESVIPANVGDIIGPMVRAPAAGACAVEFGTASNRVANLLYKSEFIKE